MTSWARDGDKCSALVIDGNPGSRSMLAAMLREYGIGNVAQTGKVLDARRHLEHKAFDVVLCDYHFDGADYTGQDLLDDLRRAQLLPFSTVFIMVTGEASYARVAEAAESALDGYLIKPHTGAALAERVHQARQRKQVLKDIFTAIEAEAFDQAARLCLERFAARQPYWIYAARIGGELLLRLGHHEAARQLFEAVAQANAVPWSRLGIARAQVEGSQVLLARRTLDALLADQPGYTDAYDVMGRVQVEQGEMEEALATFRRAAELTPSSIARLQKQGMMAWAMGDAAEAVRALERAVALGIASKMFDPQTLVLLAFAHFDRKDGKALQRCRDNLEHLLDKAPNQRRLQRFVQLAGVLRQVSARETASALDGVRDMAGGIGAESFDLEAACNQLALLARLRAGGLDVPDDEAWIAALARRFGVSKAACELLVRAAAPCEAHAERVKHEYQGVTTLAEQSMTHSLQGNAGAAVAALVNHGAQTMNAKLIDMARMVLQRHADRIDGAAALAEQVEDLRRRFAPNGTQVRLGHSGARAEGGLSLRAPVRGEDDAPPP